MSEKYSDGDRNNGNKFKDEGLNAAAFRRTSVLSAKYRIDEKISATRSGVDPMLAQDLATEICESNPRASHEVTRRIRRRRRNVRTGVTERVRPGNGTGNYTYPEVPAL